MCLQGVSVLLHRNSKVVLSVFCPTADIALNEGIPTKQVVLNYMDEFMEEKRCQRVVGRMLSIRYENRVDKCDSL